MPLRRKPPKAKRQATPPPKTIMPMIMTPAHRKSLLEFIERMDELESAIQDEEYEDDSDQEEMEEEQNEIFRSVFELCREMLGVQQT